MPANVIRVGIGRMSGRHRFGIACIAVSAFERALPRISCGCFRPVLTDLTLYACLRFGGAPAQLVPPLPGQLRAGAHSDCGSLILAAEDRPGGLQVHNAAGEWMDVPVVPNCFIINLGDLMARWTNNAWVSTLHRVVNPPLDSGAESRRLSQIHRPT